MTYPLSPDDFFHTGIVVPDLQAAAQRLSAMAGYTWTKPMAGPVTIRTAAGTKTVDMQFVYSLQEPRLELIEEVPGTPWTALPNSAVHHLGYFVDDFDAAVDALRSDGFAMEMCLTVDGDTPSMFAYFLSPDGIRVEIIDHVVFGDLGAFLKAFS